MYTHMFHYDGTATQLRRTAITLWPVIAKIYEVATRNSA